ncbi:MAG: CRISPR-associated protein Cas4 [Candidatus Thermoplasmatota archaeon]|nr:CRISPR-associated protein Cas4 [Candidatus Thermoplasmatota archaeon]
MYIFTKKELAEISTKVLPDTKVTRGWDGINECKNLNDIPISNIANTFCKSDRRVFLLSRGMDFGKSKDMLFGMTIHTVVEDLFTHIMKESLFTPARIVDYIDHISSEEKVMELIWGGTRLQTLKDLCANEREYEGTLEYLKRSVNDLLDLERDRLTSKDLNFEVELVDIERYVSGNAYNLSNGKADAIVSYGHKLGICDLKTSNPFKDNFDSKLQVTAYGLMLEYETGFDVDWGVIVFPYQKIYEKKTLRSEPFKDIFPIDQNMRNSLFSRLKYLDALVENSQAPRMCDRCKPDYKCYVEN